MDYNSENNSENIIQLTLQMLHIQIQKPVCKILCELHFENDLYLSFKTKPILRNKKANFNSQMIRIPFYWSIAIVFKTILSNHQQIYIGHYTLDLEKQLLNKKRSIKSRQKLQQTEAWITFISTIIPKQEYEADSVNNSQQIQEEELYHPLKSNYSQENTIIKKFNQKSYSEINDKIEQFKFKNQIKQEFHLSKKQFKTKIKIIDEILEKKTMFSNRIEILKQYKRDQNGNLQTLKILSLQKQLKNIKLREKIMNVIIIGFIAIFGVVIGFISKSK